ncbi:response regulator transcription factor [Sediminibacterium sp.]|uniref:response regulator transcription factor n=1 Tax=Sediminibacterium sp. TaxID=1917865 RepID=UPI0027310460|nr:response regulator transcription factor [Sediminibacterium sp.]MDP2419911.1 response regulator transcription factor [Sediminibacterium sp.]
MVEKIKIAIAEDHPLMRKAIKDIVLQTSHLKIIFDVSNGSELLIEIGKNKLQPDIILIDYFMPVLNGLETTKHIKALYPNIKVLIFSHLDEKNAIKNLFYFGINGFLSKKERFFPLETAITEILETGYFLNNFYQKIDLKVNRQKFVFAGNIKFTKKELDFIVLSVNGNKYNDIGAKMFVSIKTIENYRDSIYEKLNINSREELVKFAIKAGIVDI